LFTQVWWIAVTMFLATIPLVWIAAIAGRKSYDAEKETTKIERRFKYLSDVLMNREAVEERSVYGYSEYLNSDYVDKFEFSRKFRVKVTRNYYLKSKVSGIVVSLYSVAAMLALLPNVLNEYMDFGMFVGLMGGVFYITNEFSWGIHEMIEGLTGNRAYLDDLTEFMALDDQPNSNALPSRTMSFKTIEFKGVSFKYPDTEKLILNNISFMIESGKHYSFVGVNGAGKTTITKLITGLYNNYSGEINVDGRSLRSFSQAELKGLSSVVYQDFARYFISVYENVATSFLADNVKTNDELREETKRVIELVGLGEAVDLLPNGIDTPLGKILANGVDLSGGQWQRLAMARCVMSNAPLKILDEPTAALDPISESTVYKNFEQISKGGTTIFISHRLGSTKLADVIYVLDDGRIVEEGTHVELMAIKDGVYREMFNSQANWYQAEGVSK